MPTTVPILPYTKMHSPTQTNIYMYLQAHKYIHTYCDTEEEGETQTNQGSFIKLKRV